MRSDPIGPDALFELLDVALGVEGADEVEARISHSWGGLARFAGNAIHQHVATEDVSVAVRAVVGGRAGTASTNDATEVGVEAAARRALAAARLSRPDPAYPGLAGPAPLPEVSRRYDTDTAAASPARRAQAVAALLEPVRQGQEAAGAVSTRAEEVALATTAGARHHGTATSASVQTVVMGGGASGHAETAGVSLDDLDPADVGTRGAATCAAAVDPGEVEPGTWEVVLLPSAAMTLLEWLAFTTFSAKACAEGRSAFSDLLGEQVAAPMVTIADDALADGALGLTFDDEGTPRRRVELIQEGKAVGMVHDRTSAAAAGVTSTGHGLPAPNPWGPLARHLVLTPGSASVDELLAGIDRGLLVTRFWYSRAVNPKKSLVTGMTRDGTFLIQGGAVGPPVRNLRYNQSILEALASCDGIGNELHLCSDELGDSWVPALRLRSFTFTSTSDH